MHGLRLITNLIIDRLRNSKANEVVNNCFDLKKIKNGGDREIRTLGTVRRFDTLARCSLRPLGHVSAIVFQRAQKMAVDTGFEPADP